MVQKVLGQNFPNIIIFISVLVFAIGLGQVVWPATPEEGVIISATTYWTIIIGFFTLIPLIVVLLDETKLGIVIPGDGKEWAWCVMVSVVGCMIILASQVFIPHQPGMLTPVSIGPTVGYIMSTIFIPLVQNAIYPAIGETIFFLGFFGVVAAYSRSIGGILGIPEDVEFYNLWKYPQFWMIIFAASMIASTFHYIYGGFGYVDFLADPFAAFGQIFLPQEVQVATEGHYIYECFVHPEYCYYQTVMPAGFFALIMFLVFSAVSFLPRPLGALTLIAGILTHFEWNSYVWMRLMGIGIEWFAMILAGLFAVSLFYYRRRV